MIRIEYFKTAFIVVFLLLTVGSFSQDAPSAPGNSQDCIINRKMIEKFRATSNKVEVISWQNVLINNSFEEVKSYLNAYISIDLNEVDPDELKQAINNKIDENAENLKSGLDKTYPIASND